MSDNGLNPRQEKFCLNYFSGMSAYQACRNAGYSEATALSHVKRMVENGGIQRRLSELHEAAESAKVMDVTERKERLSDFGREDIKTKKGILIRSGNIGAIAELNKMEHVYEVGAKVLIDNRTLEVTVVSPEGQSLLDKVKDGQGTDEA